MSLWLSSRLCLTNQSRDSIGQLSLAFTKIVIQDQNLFGNTEKLRELLNLLPAKTKTALYRTWGDQFGNLSNAPNLSTEIWSTLRSALRDSVRRNDVSWERLFQATINSFQMSLKLALEDIIIYYMHPRLDANVTCSRQHLLKAPFCVHPGTSHICVPFDPAQAGNFDLSAVPTLDRVLRELDFDHVDDCDTPGALCWKEHTKGKALLIDKISLASYFPEAIHWALWSPHQPFAQTSRQRYIE